MKKAFSGEVLSALVEVRSDPHRVALCPEMRSSNGRRVIFSLVLALQCVATLGELLVPKSATRTRSVPA
uniref:Transposase n=1 Tax=Steinernema glaseri TaxID=37863 RepID=A0A1I7ZC52_9BILA